MSLRIGTKKLPLRVARALLKVQRAVQDAYVASGLSQQEIAKELGVDRSVIHRRLRSSSNLTVRSLAELSSVFGKELVVEFRSRPVGEGVNNIALNTKTHRDTAVTWSIPSGKSGPSISTSPEKIRISPHKSITEIEVAQ